MNKDFYKIFEKVKDLSGIEKKARESEEAMILRGLDLIGKKLKKEEEENQKNNGRLNAVLEVIMSVAQLDYSKKAKLSNQVDYIDALASGINMLGEEMKVSTVSLHEKETLLKEIHHRVKNNLQIISSLLNLQADQIDDPAFKEKYRVSRDRIRSMALVHEKLYESENLSLIDFGDYVLSLAKSLNISYNPDNSRIAMKLDVAENEGLFKIETAIPCGLILNELLSNSFKYAFLEENKGNISVFFGCIGENRADGKSGKNKKEYCLSVKDDGRGLPENLNPHEADSLGFQLITILTEQLDGKLSLNRKEGTEFSLVFSG
jgi:two-component sensor histidine kinase